MCRLLASCKCKTKCPCRVTGANMLYFTFAFGSELHKASCWGKSDKELSSCNSIACKYLLYLWWKNVADKAHLLLIWNQKMLKIWFSSSPGWSVCLKFTHQDQIPIFLLSEYQTFLQAVIHLEKPWSLQ